MKAKFQNYSQKIAQSWKKLSDFQSLFVSVLFKIILLSLVSLNLSVQAAPVITNTANASFSINGVNQNISDQAHFTKDTVVAPNDVIELQKQSNVSSALVGSHIIYTLTVRNPNPRPLNNVKIQDILPIGVVYKNNTAALDGTLISANNVGVSGNNLNFTLGNIPANTSVKLNYQTNVSSNTPTGIATNRATAASDTATSSQVKSNVNISRPVVVIPTTPLILTKSANASDVKIGGIVRYTLTIESNNAKTISGVEVTDLLPEGLTYIPNSAKFNNNPIAVNQENPLIFNINSIAANSNSELIYDVKVDDNSGKPSNTRELINTAYAIASDTKANSNKATANVTIVNDTLLLSKSTNSTTVTKGDIVDYTVTLTNPALRTLNNLTIKDVLPQGFTYIAGSATLNNTAFASDDVISHANNIDFKIATVASEATLIVSYQVKVNDNAKPGDNTNTAQALSDFAASIAATATVKVRTPSTINFLKINHSGVSSIIQATSYNTNQEGGKNFEEINSISLLDGTTINLPTPQPIVDADQYTAGEPVVIEVIDLDQNLDPDKLETIEVTVSIPGTNDTEILLLTETSPDSGVFRGIVLTTTDATVVQNGLLTVADGVKINVNYRDEQDITDTSASAALFVPDTQLQIEKTVDKDYSSIGELVRYKLEFRNTSSFNLINLQVNDLLPLGFRYMPNTAYLNGVRLEQNVSFDGRALRFNLNNMPAESSWKIEYVTKISAGAQVGDAVNTAYFTSNTLRSNDAQAIVKIKDDLMRSKNILTGRVYIGCKTQSDKNSKAPQVLKDARIYIETGRSVLTDTEGFWHMEGVYPGAHVVQLDTESILGFEPLLCDDNTRRAKDAKSHFVDLQAGNLWHVDFHVKPIKGYKKETESIIEKTRLTDPVEIFNQKYLDSAEEGFDILWPKNNYVPAVASTKIFVKSSPKHKVEVFLNGSKVSPLNYDGSETNKLRTVTIRRWFGVDIDIKRKNNTLLAILKDKSGKELARKTHNIHFSSKPASAELVREESVLIADGKTTPVITLKVKDEDGFPMRANTHGYFTLENNKYRVKNTNSSDTDAEDLGKNFAGTYKYLIEEGGFAKIELHPTTQSGQLKLKLKFSETNSIKQDVEVAAWLKPALRDWIMVGIAEGTLSNKKLSGNMQALKDLDKSTEFDQRGRVAFFAKGQIKGKYLLTIAYDTHKRDREMGSQLNGNIDPDAFYTIYADNSSSQYDAPSSEKLYLKLERESFYALFGDYQTEMTITELAKYQRTLSGIKTEYQGNRLSYSGFISETSNNHHHQEIPGDGTSGLYYLDNDIVRNSETITIETRDRFRSDKIIESRQLSRYQDYNIDYEDGTLFFTFPITSRDANFNPNIIVIDYDSAEHTNKSITAGGRIAVKSKNGALETGVSYLHEGQTNSDDNQLLATDLTYKVSPDTKIKAEVAQSKTVASEHQKRMAYVLELEKESEKMQARLYLKKHESSFGIDSQASEIGIEKAGAELNYRLNQNTRINSEVSVQKNIENNNKRRLAKIELKRQIKQYQFNVGYRHTQEELEADNSSTETFQNDTLLLGGRYTTKNGKVTLRTDLEKNISNINGSEISPDRLIVGIDVKLAQGFSVFAEHETTDNSNLHTHNNRVGLSKNLWKGAKARTTYTQEQSTQGLRDYATIGLTQNVKLNKKINADFSIDQTKTMGDSSRQNRFNQDEPKIQGAERDDYTAFSVGLNSNDEDWSWSTRAEYRKGELYDKTNFLASISRHYSNGKNLNAKLSFFDSKYEDGDFSKDIKLSFGSAWHPKEKDFVFFSRLDLVSEKSSDNVIENDNGLTDTSEKDTQKIIHNMHYNRKINNKTQLGIHHGIKYVKDQNNGVTSSSTIDTATVQLRRDINKRWDIGVHGGYLRDWGEDTTEYVAGVSLGVTPRENIWLELGYNVEGFSDEDFDNNNYTNEGVYLNFRYKFNQDSLRRKPVADTKKIPKETPKKEVSTLN